jgi:ribose transport system permease protein
VTPFLPRFVRRHPETGTIALVAIVSILFVAITNGLWLSLGNVQSVVRLTAVLAIMSFGEAIVIATGAIDISVGSTFGIGALTFLGIAPIGGSGIALVAALLAGIFIGALNGFFRRRARDIVTDRHPWHFVSFSRHCLCRHLRFLIRRD